MADKIMDITPDERYLLSSLKRRSAMYLGKSELTRFVSWTHGYYMANYIAKCTTEHNILPDGLNDYAALKYLGHLRTSLDYPHLILEKEPDEKKALIIFFDLLDEYLIHLGYQPIPIWDDIKNK